MYELLIIGAGPAGITAAVYAARKKMDFLLLSQDVGGQTAWSGDIENYTGYQFITGPELAAKFEEHMRKFGIPLKEGETCLKLERSGDAFTVTTDKASYTARSVIVASGKRSRELDVPGEKEYRNRGLAYCATCDGPLFAGKDVAVVGGGNSALDAGLQLAKYCRSVTMVNIGPSFTGDALMQEQLAASPLVSVWHNSKVLAVHGSRFVEGVTVARAGKEQLLPVQGVFVEIGLIPNVSFAGILEKNEAGEIKINSRNETSVPGIFAAGDVTDVEEKQIIIAAGEGAKAVLSAFKYLLRHG